MSRRRRTSRAAATLAAGLVAGLLLGAGIAGAATPAAPAADAAPAVAAPDEETYDLRRIRVGMSVQELPEAGFAGFRCTAEPAIEPDGFGGFRQCPADAAGTRALQFGYDPASDPEGTMVAGHPVVLSLRVDASGRVTALVIRTDPQARLYKRKKAFLLGAQALLRYGEQGWQCTHGQPGAQLGEVGGVFVDDRCEKKLADRTVTVERHLYRRADQDAAHFVSESVVEVALSR